MGLPKRHRKTYSTPSHPWQKERIDEEKVIQKDYGTKNKKEIWKIRSQLSKLTNQAKRLIVEKGEQAEKEKRNLFEKLARLGLITSTDISLDDVLGISLNALMERRLQTLVLRKGFARTIKQSRQFITHDHISVGGKIVTSPNFIVTKEDEGTIQFIDKSSLSDPEHPERKIEKLKPEEVEVLAKKKDASKNNEKKDSVKEKSTEKIDEKKEAKVVVSKQ